MAAAREMQSAAQQPGGEPQDGRERNTSGDIDEGTDVPQDLQQYLQAGNPSSLSTTDLTPKAVTYADVVQAVHDAMTPIMQAHTSTLKKAVQDLKGQLTQLSHTVTNNECRLGELFQDASDLKQRYDELQKSHLQLSNKVEDLEN